MRPYGVRFVGPTCRYGCCWRTTGTSTFRRRIGHGWSRKKRERRLGREVVVRELNELWQRPHWSK